MIKYLHTPEYRIVIPGKAVSFRSRKSGEYKSRIRTEARKIISSPITGQVAEVRLDYFHQDSRRMDMDNISKCVLDALNTIAYGDDQQVRLQSAEAHSLSSVVHISRGILDIIKPLQQYQEYLFIRIRDVSSLSFD